MFYLREFYTDVTFQTSLVIVNKGMRVLSCLISMSLKLSEVRKCTTCLLKVVQVVFNCLDFVDVFKHTTDFLLKSVPRVEHSSSSSYKTTNIIMLEVVFKKGFCLVKGFSFKVRCCL